MAKPFIPQIVTGNDLKAGDVVFRAAGGRWSRLIAEAEVATTPEAANALLAAAIADSQTRTVSIERIDVAVGDGVITPLHIRERIRLSGPTVRADFRRDDNVPL